MKKMPVMIISAALSIILSSCFSDQASETLKTPAADNAAMASTMTLHKAFTEALDNNVPAGTKSSLSTGESGDFSYTGTGFSVNGTWSESGTITAYTLVFDFDNYTSSYTDKNGHSVTVTIDGTVSAVMSYDSSTLLYESDLTTASPVDITYGSENYTVELDISYAISEVPPAVIIDGTVTVNGTDFSVSYSSGI